MIETTIKLKKTGLDEHKKVSYSIKRSIIHILFTSEVPINFYMQGGRSMPLPPFSSYMFFEQDQDYEFEFGVESPTTMIALEIPITSLHQLIARGIDDMNFGDDKFNQSRYHKFDRNNNQVNTVLGEIHATNNGLLLEAKKYELLNYYFSNPEVKSYECPFLNQKENVQKVRDAKKYLINDLQNSPTIKELSKEVGLNEHNLKTGFKEIYGKPIHTFLKDHKMKTAQILLDERQLLVNEIAERMGYSNVSHFIEAFKVKYGLTPKQYQLNQ